MQYMLLIYEDPAELARLSAGERQGIFREYRQFTDSIVKSGNYRPATRSSRSRPRPRCGCGKGKRMVTDGPFAETKSTSAATTWSMQRLDEALGIPPRGAHPSARFGAVEVRPS